MEENDIDRILAASFTGEKLSEEERCLLEEWKQEDGHKWFENELHELKELGKDLKSREDKNLVFARIEKKCTKATKRAIVYSLEFYCCKYIVASRCCGVFNVFSRK